LSLIHTAHEQSIVGRFDLGSSVSKSSQLCLHCVCVCVCVHVFLSWWGLKPECTQTHGNSCHCGDL